MGGRLRRYFFSFLPVCLRSVVPFGFILSVANALIFRSLQELLIYIPLWTLFGVGLALTLAWIASRRRPLSRPQDASGLIRWHYPDIAAPYTATFNGGVDILSAFCKAEPIAQDAAKGVLLCETRPTLGDWGSEISLWVESYGEDYSRVQVLVRPVVATAVADFGSNQRNLNRVVAMLRTRFPVVAEGR